MIGLDKTSTHIHDRPEMSCPHEMGNDTNGAADPVRLVELERENSRLHRLVAELLIKNQQLRRAD